MFEEHHREVESIIEREFGCRPHQIERMGNGICNEVYRIRAGDLDCVVRLKAEARYMYGSHDHIPIFRNASITVPEILAEDYSKTRSLFAYQVLSIIPGRDINDVIHTLTDGQLRAIAGHISFVFDALKDVPNNGKFGDQWGDDDDLVDSWTDDIARMTKVVIGWGTRTGVLDAETEGILEWINAEYKPYFDSAACLTYYGDICAKNVMIHNGEFAGLVDLDALSQGDPLEAIGRIKASWYGTHHGSVYAEAVMDEQCLDRDHRRIVTMYALLNRAYWTMENGIQFNQNTSTRVDPLREKQDKAAVRALHKELQSLLG